MFWWIRHAFSDACWVYWAYCWVSEFFVLFFCFSWLAGINYVVLALVNQRIRSLQCKAHMTQLHFVYDQRYNLYLYCEVFSCSISNDCNWKRLHIKHNLTMFCNSVPCSLSNHISNRYTWNNYIQSVCYINIRMIQSDAIPPFIFLSIFDFCWNQSDIIINSNFSLSFGCLDITFTTVE